MSQWKVDGAGEYIPAHEINETTLMTKHNNVPHTPTPTLSLYGDHPYVPTSTSWNFEDQRRLKAYPTNPTTNPNPETTTRTISYQQQVSDNNNNNNNNNKQLWSRQEKLSNKRPMDYTSPNTNTNNNNNNNNNKNISHPISSPSSSLLHPLANDYVNLHSDGSSIRTTPSQVIPPVTLPTNHHQDHRIGNQGMVTLVDNKQHQTMKQQQQQQQQQQQHHHHHHQYQQQQLSTHSGHSLYSGNKDTTHRSAKYHYSRSFSDTPHSLLSYHHPHHHPHSSQHRHNSIATTEHAAAIAAAAAAYQSQSMNPGQMTWYGQQTTSTFQKGSTTTTTSNTTTPPPLYNHSSSSSPRLSKRQNETEVYPGSNYTPMSDLLVSSRMDNVEYGIASTSSSTSGHFLGQHRSSHQWTSSSSSSSSSSPAPQSPRTGDMHSLLSISFTPTESYNNNNNNNKKNNDTPIMDQQQQQQQGNKTNVSNLSTTTPSSLNHSSADSKKKAKKSQQQQQQQQQQQKPPTGKRRSPNAFFVYCSDRRQILKQGKPNARNTDINRQLGMDWKALTKAEQNWYKEKANKIRASLPNDNTPTPKSMTTNLFTTCQSNSSPFTYPTFDPVSSFDSSFSDFTHSPNGNRSNSLALTIAADDESVTSYGTGSRKRGSLANSDLSCSSSSSSAVPSPSQHPLAVASLSGAAEANALDQAALVGTHPCQDPENKVERLKRPPNAYLLFNREMRRKLLDQNENLTVALISKLISQSWRDLPQETKDGYRNEAAKLKKQHLEDHPDFVYIRRSRTQLAQAGYRSRPSKKRKKSLDNEESIHVMTTTETTLTKETTLTTNDSETTTTSANKDGRKQPTRRFPDPRGRKKKKHKNPFGPKHPMSGFLYFASEVRPEIVQTHPKSNVGVISKVMAERWKKMTEQDKLPWIEKAQQDKDRYAREVLAFKLAQDQNKQQQQQQQQQQAENNNDGWHQQEWNDNGDVTSTKKSSISSLSSSSTSSTTTTTTTTPAIPSTKDTMHRNEPSLYHHHHHHHHHHHNNHHQHQQQQQQQQKQFYKPVSRIHSALTSSRPASPTELDSHTIQTVAQMVNPRNHAPTLGRELHPLSTSSSLASIMHHHHESSVGSFQLHVPATPPSPAIDTI